MKRKIVNWFYFLIGVFFLLLAKIKYYLFGYNTPKTFSINETQRCIKQDVKIVDGWMTNLNHYVAENKLSIKNKHILELGPGSDLGIGLYLLSKSVKKYTAVDVYDLVSLVPNQFYDAFFSYLKEQEEYDNVASLREELDKTKKGCGAKLNYVCRKDFDIVKALNGDKVDIVFSNASFEHFDDIEKTIKSVSEVTLPGALFVVAIDLQTHSRWIREKDPNNIYRYPEWLYRLLTQQSSPNRIRPYQYKEALEKYGWGNIVINPGLVLPEDKYQFVKEYLNKNFRDSINQMDYLSVWMYATKLNLTNT